MDLSVHNTDIWWSMLVKFSKQIGNSCAKIINTKVNSKPCQTAEIELFAIIVKNEKPFTIFAKTFILDVWQGSEYASELASKVKDVSFLNQFKYER